MPTNNCLIGTADLQLIQDALRSGLDVRLHPDKYGVKITSEKVRVLRKPEAGAERKQRNDLSTASGPPPLSGEAGRELRSATGGKPPPQ